MDNVLKYFKDTLREAGTNWRVCFKFPSNVVMLIFYMKVVIFDYKFLGVWDVLIVGTGMLLWLVLCFLYYPWVREYFDGLVFKKIRHVLNRTSGNIKKEGIESNDINFEKAILGVIKLTFKLMFKVMFIWLLWFFSAFLGWFVVLNVRDRLKIEGRHI